MSTAVRESFAELCERIREPRKLGPVLGEAGADDRIEARLAALGVRVRRYAVDPADFRAYLASARYAEDAPDYYATNRAEKALEHYLAAKLLGLGPGQVYIDVASEHSPVPEIYARLFGVTAYRQDLSYPAGVHGDRIGGDAAHMPVADTFAHAMGLHCSFEHFEGRADADFIAEVGRVLRPGGAICVVPLYLAEDYAIQTDPEVAVAGGVAFEVDATVHCTQGWGNRHGRFYDPEHLASRVLTSAAGLEVEIYRIENAARVDPSCYARFAMVIRKPLGTKVLVLNGDLPVFPGWGGVEYLHTTRLARLTGRVGLVSMVHTAEQFQKKQSLVDAGLDLYLWESPSLGAPPGPPPRRSWRRRLLEAVYQWVRNRDDRPADTLIQDFQFRNMAASIEQALEAGDWQALVVVQSNCARWLDYLPPMPASVLVLHDARALVFERQAQSAATAWERRACRREARRYRRFEREYCRRYDLVVTVSDADEAYVREHYQPRRLMTVPLPVDNRYFGPVPGIAERPARILFTGMMAHPPNADAAQFFAREVLPRVQAEIPDAEFWIVGRDPSPAVRALAAVPGVVVTGFVSDMRPYLAQATVVVVPLRFGAGMRQKILEAWAMQKCVVSTRIGAEGLDARHGENVFLADDAPSLAARVIEAIRDPGARDRVRAEGRALVSTAHDPDRLARRYHDGIASVLRDKREEDGHLRAVIDLRWMYPGRAGGIENLSRAFIGELARLDGSNRYTVLLPAETRYDWDLRARDNFALVAADGPRRQLRRAWLAAVRRLHHRARLHYWRSPEVEDLRAAADLGAEIALSIPGFIHRELWPLTNVLVVPDIQHEYRPEFFSPGELAERRRLYTDSARRAAHICAISEFTRQTLIERLGIAPERITTTHLAADPVYHPGSAARGNPGPVLAKYGLPAGQYLLFPGNTWPHKNHRRAFEALAILKEAHGLDPLLVCTGATKNAHGGIVDALRATGLEDRVRFLGYCPTADMPALYEGAAALLFPSLFEGFGIPLVEAMWCGCPIVASGVTSLPEIAGDAALLVDPESPESIADALRRALVSEDVRRDLIARGHRRAPHFSWTRFTLAVVGAMRAARRARYGG